MIKFAFWAEHLSNSKKRLIRLPRFSRGEKFSVISPLRSTYQAIHWAESHVGAHRTTLQRRARCAEPEGCAGIRNCSALWYAPCFHQVATSFAVMPTLEKQTPLSACVRYGFVAKYGLKSSAISWKRAMLGRAQQHRDFRLRWYDRLDEGLCRCQL